MIEVLEDDKKIQVPNYLSISQYQKIQKNPIKYNDPYEMLALYLDMEKTELMDLPYRDVKFIENYISIYFINLFKCYSVFFIKRTKVECIVSFYSV